MRTEIKLLLTVILIYGFYATMTGPHNSVDSLCIGIVENGSLEISEEVTGDYAELNGKRYSGFSPGLSFILSPFYWLTKALCRLAPADLQFQAFSMIASMAFSIPLGALCVVALYRMLREWNINARPATLTALAFAFGTMWFVYARRHNSTSFVAAALIFLAFYFLTRPPASRPIELSHVMAGFLALLGVASDYKQALTVIWLGVYILLQPRPWRQLGHFCIGAVGPATAILAYNWAVWGHPLYTSYKFLKNSYAIGDGLQPGVIPLQGTLHFQFPAFVKLLIGPRTGFFVYMPVFLLALAGITHSGPTRVRPLTSVFVITTGILVTNALLAASSHCWWAGSDQYFQGPATRYLLTAVPFLMIFVGVGLQEAKSKKWVWLIVLSILITWCFVLSENYGKGESPIAPGWQNAPLVFHARYIWETFGAESIWFKLLASSRFNLDEPTAAAITWLGFAGVGFLVWSVWRIPGRKLQDSSG